MATYSMSPVRRAEGYLTAMVEWGYCTYAEARDQYNDVRRVCRVKYDRYKEIGVADYFAFATTDWL